MKDLHIDIYAPITKQSFGPLSFDPVEVALGMPLTQKMKPLLRGVHAETQRNGAPAYHLPCSVKDGAELSLSLGPLGTLSIGNDGGLLTLGMPDFVANNLGEGVQAMVVNSQNLNPGLRIWLRLAPGAAAKIPLAQLGILEFLIPD